MYPNAAPCLAWPWTSPTNESIALVVDVALAILLIPHWEYGARCSPTSSRATWRWRSRSRRRCRHPASGTPRRVWRLLAVIGHSVAVAYACGVLGGMVDPAVGVLAAYATGTCCFVASLSLQNSSAGCLPRRRRAPRRAAGAYRAALPPLYLGGDDPARGLPGVAPTPRHSCDSIRPDAREFLCVSLQ